jgi:hypothetical protein
MTTATDEWAMLARLRGRIKLLAKQLQQTERKLLAEKEAHAQTRAAAKDQIATAKLQALMAAHSRDANLVEAWRPILREIVQLRNQHRRGRTFDHTKLFNAMDAAEHGGPDGTTDYLGGLK